MIYMSFWYAALFVVIEGWRELGLTDTRIDILLQSPNVELLRRYRNGAFHFQREYFDVRFMDFVKEPDTVQWVRELNEKFWSLILDDLNKTLYAKKEPPSKPAIVASVPIGCLHPLTRDRARLGAKPELNTLVSNQRIPSY